MAGPDDDREADRQLRPLIDGLSILDGRTGAIADRLSAIEAGLLELRSAQPDPNQLVAPLVDRLAIVSDRTTALGSQLQELAGAVGGLRANRPELQGMVASVTDQLNVVADTLRGAQERLDTLAAAVGDLRANRPDVSNSLRALATLIESIRIDGAETRARIDALAAGGPITVAAPIRASGGDAGEQFDRVRQLLATLAERQNDARAQGQQVLERSAAAAEGIQGLHDRLESLARAAAAAAPPIGPGPEAGAAPVADLAPVLEPLTTGIDELRDQLTALRTAIETSTSSDAPSPTSATPAAAPATVNASVVKRLEQAASDVSSARDVLAAGVERVLGRLDADTNRILDTMSTGDPDLRDTVQRVDVGLVELRRELDRWVPTGLPVPAPAPQAPAPAEPVSSSNDAEAIRRELQDIRVEVVATGRAITGLQATLQAGLQAGLQAADMRRGDDVNSGAGAALVASAAAAMARLEARMDGEFDSLGRQLDAIGALMKEVADTVERRTTAAAEQPPSGDGRPAVGPRPDQAPASERVRTVAAQLLDSLRAAARNRPARRPPELPR